MKTTLSRRTLLKGLAAAPAAGAAYSIPRYAHAAEIRLRYGNNLPLSHPLNIRAKEAADRIAKETNGRAEMLIFPANQLGGDTDMLSQVRSGGLTFFTPSSLVIATLVPAAARITRWIVGARTPCRPFRTRSTVAVETPA